MRLKPCAYLGCAALIERGTFCERHGGQRDDRPNAAARGYGKRWAKLRDSILRRDPVCKACNAEPSTDADHIVPKRRGGTDDPDNLQGLCHSCHSRKTQRGD